MRSCQNKSCNYYCTLQLEKNTYMNLCFRTQFSEKMFSYINRVSIMNVPKIALHVSICDPENYTKKFYWNFVPGKRSSFMISVTRNNVFGVNSAIMSGGV